jgi:Cu2+-exporting ATPase
MPTMSTAISTNEHALTQVPCAHCGLPAPPPRVDAEPSFCCHGCQGAYELIRSWGLEEFYELQDAPSTEIPGGKSKSFDDLDDPRLLGRSAPLALQSTSDTPLLSSNLAISGLHCAACAWLIERAPQRISGWHSATVNMHSRTVDVVFDPTTIRLSEIAKFLHRLGYDISPLDDPAVVEETTEASRRILMDVAFSGFCAANAMWIAIALYAGQFTGIAAGHAQFLRFAGVALGFAAVVFPGRVFFRSAMASISTRTPHMDLPVAVGLSAGLAASLYALLDPHREVYFDSIACLVFFLLTGRWLQMRQQRRAGETVAELIRMSPVIATQIDDDGNRVRVSVDELSVGDLVLVQASESIPVDGVVVDGESTVDRSLLTGESFPVDVVVGSEVETGTDNVQASLTIRVTALGESTRLAAIKNAVVDAAATRTPIVLLANRIGAWFVIVVLGLALLTLVAWWWIEPARAVSNVVALLIVACPCALALATPLAIAVSIGRLAKRQVLVRSGDCLERLSKPGTIFFDKTGTLTEGRMRVAEWFGPTCVLRDIACIESGINHPIAVAIVDYSKTVDDPDEDQPETGVATNVQYQIGRGVSGTVDRRSYRIGSLRLLKNDDVAIKPDMEQTIADIIASGLSPIVVVADRSCQAVFGVVDPLRSDAPDLVNALRRRGWRVELLSGDHQPVVSRVAASLGVKAEHAHGELLPEEKLAAIRSASGKGPVLMVGDGVNDAAALAAADVGVAVRGGARASLAAAPVVIGNGKLQGVLELTGAALQTRRTISRNFVISIGYNIVAVALAMTGLITPLIAALLMPLSSLTVLGLTLASPRQLK